MTGKEIVDRWWPHRNPDGCRGDLINVINAAIDAVRAAEEESWYVEPAVSDYGGCDEP
jgi:hypothetical protein